jgi:hypothetical protein
VDVDLTVSIPVSGLQPLAHYRFMKQRQAYSQQTAWKKFDTEGDIRLLLYDMGLTTNVKAHFVHVEAAIDRISTAQRV